MPRDGLGQASFKAADARAEKRFRHGLVLGKFYPLHAGHSHLIDTATSVCDRVTVQVLASAVESIPLGTRAAWVRELHPSVVVKAAMDEAPVDYDSPAAWDAHMSVIESLLDTPVDAVFTSDGYGQELARRLDATWVPTNPGRIDPPLSGTAIRADLATHWSGLAPAVRADLAVRVVVLGAESTGTSTLAQALASSLCTSVVAEYGREYALARPGGPGAPWASAEFQAIVDGQLALERAALRSTPTPVLVCDTDVLTTALFHEFYEGTRAQWIVDQARRHRPALYLLTGDEIPFVDDATRASGSGRAAMQQRFREELTDSGVAWVEVRGDVEERVVQSLEAIDRVVPQFLTFAPPLG